MIFQTYFKIRSIEVPGHNLIKHLLYHTISKVK